MTAALPPAQGGHVRTGWLALSAVAVLVALGACSEPAEDPAAGRTEEVSVPADELALEGTLWLPTGEGPHVGVVLVHGSGPLSRRGLLPGQLGLTFPSPVPVYEQLAEGLSDAGLAVLSYDKRTCGPFNGCADNGYPEPAADLRFATLVDDAAAALDYLVARPDIDRLVLVGHSKGGTMAAVLTGRRDDLAATVLLAAPAVPIDRVLAAQAATLADLVRAAGQGGPGAEEAVGQLRDLADEVATVAAGDTRGAPIGGVQRSFWAEWLAAAEDGLDAVRASDPPVLVLGGSLDWNVPEDQVRAWEPVLGPEDELGILQGITHALTRLSEPDPAAISLSDVGTRLDPEVLKAITDWLPAAASGD